MGTGLLAAALIFSPLLAFLFSTLVVREHRTTAIGVSLLGGTVSLAAAVQLYLQGPVAEPVVFTWLSVSEMDITFGVFLDGLNLMMGLVVAGVSFLIQIYSVGYMAKDPGCPRYFGFLSLFSWAMLTFVFSPNLLQTFIFWELVGLASFLLIGFWYQKPSAVRAARKAFIMTRIGDVGLFLGVVLLFELTGTMDILLINQGETLSAIAPASRDLITLLLFLGIVGKSAQFPLHTWLPDAMEGPTPVSALLHSATMVAAGVFLFARFHPLFMAAEATLMLVMSIAAFTAILASTIAMVDTDIKKVLAYSSISQLGFMLMGLAAGGLFAGFFHLVTHAIFKALLFLCAGAYIYQHGTNDMVAIGRAGGRRLKATTIGLFAGGAALAGLPPFAGFFSKESILVVVGQTAPPMVLAAAYLAALLTSYYTFRMIFLIVRPNADSDATIEEEADPSHAHGDGSTPWVMKGPILLLAVGAVGLGFLGEEMAAALGLSGVQGEWSDLAPALAVSFGGVLWAWIDFGYKGAAQTGGISRLASLNRLFVNKWFIDAFYERVVVRFVEGVARVCQVVEEECLDESADQMGAGAVKSGWTVSRWQSGQVQLYIGTAVGMVAIFVVYLGIR